MFIFALYENLIFIKPFSLLFILCDKSFVRKKGKTAEKLWARSQKESFLCEALVKRKNYFSTGLNYMKHP